MSNHISLIDFLSLDIRLTLMDNEFQKTEGTGKGL